ncbi:hypothetical protein O181_010001 [Austropuccinia psidii MF-1]|uniref:Integrase catalytic domain-containing protein n=1 Tax=Austropuccinia psidii MF-1 TaxID=1389203 RepID=A0A9Q3BSY1_9BASI|nr:hypothetical protein [Austropuccinia psidii MF-1]
MDWVTALPPGRYRSFKECLVLVDRLSKTPIFLSFNKDDIAMDTAIIIWTGFINHRGLLKNTISDRDQKFTSSLWKNIHKCFATKLLFSTTYHPQTYGLAERMIQNLEDIIKRFCAYGLQFKDHDGFTYCWCTLIPGLELEYKKSIKSSTGKAPERLEPNITLLKT